MVDCSDTDSLSVEECMVFVCSLFFSFSIICIIKTSPPCGEDELFDEGFAVVSFIEFTLFCFVSVVWPCCIECLILLRFGGNCLFPSFDPFEEPEDILFEGEIDELDCCF